MVWWRTGLTIHRGRTQASVERAVLSCGWNKWSGDPSPGFTPPVLDRRQHWLLDEEVRHGLPEQWQRVAWDRWCASACNRRQPGLDGFAGQLF